MRILHLAYRDTSGVPGRWAAAHRAAGHDAALFVELPHPYAYQAADHVERWTPGTRSAKERAAVVADHLGWADAVMAYDHPFYLDAALESGKPVMFRGLGQSVRDYSPELKRLLRHPNVVRATVGMPDLSALLGVAVVGAPYPLLEPAEPAGLVLCHAPSDRESKGTAEILRAAQGTGWTVDLVERESNDVVLAHKRRAALVVDSLGALGYGVNAIEGMALGLPVLAGAVRDVRDHWTAAGSPVVFVRDESHLRQWLLALADDEPRRAMLGGKGRAFVADFHSAHDRAREDMAAIEALAVAA